MTETEKAYIAGIIDGEGSIMLQKFHAKEHPSPCVSIASTTLELLKWIKIIVGKGVIVHKKNYNPERHQDCYSYQLKYNDAINLIKDIYPYLIIKTKRKRAELILTRYKEVTPRNGRYSEEMLKDKLDFYDEFMSIK
ncbi:LAGLIDADG family homing endonuclease [Clostridium sp. D53t1_180928_C8]|uniref:LAGLIDADG family homing endonuclease n=1 Tax=Clostridium sp. D53t1_180928_C8 TaxID=2787101 RepID=UPI0018AA4925|nr:LAGLIDADG family homing endonuclease [Clostridium sp. D53t1_180928_C8]